ncbi:sigma-70 family RNA polymerase sigma factor [Rheinheimera riviphila]|nr:sigma-70 family RNA polymerase sigma factor [Rheinheimera riviphila]
MDSQFWNTMSNKQIRYEALVRAFHADLFRYAFWLCHQRTVAEDLVQETFLRAWKSLDSLQEAAAAKGWLITILRRENARRFERKQFDYQDVDQDWLEDEHSEGPEQTAENQQLHQYIARLAEEYREPLVLQVLLGMTGDEIAQTLELNLNTVNTRLFRARQQLRELLLQSPATGASQHG